MSPFPRWHREGFKRFWTRRSRAAVGLIRKMSRSNVTWGAPRIRNELVKLGIEVGVSTAARLHDEAAQAVVAILASVLGQRYERAAS